MERRRAGKHGKEQEGGGMRGVGRRGEEQVRVERSVEDREE